MTGENRSAIASAQSARAGQEPGDPSRHDLELTRAAWRANLRQELCAPVDGIIEWTEILLDEAREHERTDLLADLNKIHSAGTHLRILLQGLLEPPANERERRELEHCIRHELGNCLNPIIGYCEQWLEDAADLLVEPFVPELEKVLSLGKQIAAGLDKLLQTSKAASDPEINLDVESLPEMYRLTADLPSAVPSLTGSILIIEDNETNRDLISRWLRRDGHTVVEAANGRDGLALLRTRPFDVVLLDIIMPHMNGYQVLAEIKSDPCLRHLPVIMISAFSEIDSVVRCIEHGAEDYLTKPIKSVLLRARLNACLEKKRLLEEIEKERRRADELLHVILPAPIVNELKTSNQVKPCRHENVAVLFCDIAGFTSYCDHTEPEQVFPHLQRLIEAWEESALRHRVEKIKTIGDAFMAAAGLLREDVANPVRACVALGEEMIRLTRSLTPWNIRIGIHAGPVVAGVIGRRQYLFDLWGDTVNTAARMESHGIVGSITLSGAAWRHISHCAQGERRGHVEIKGKGCMDIYRFESFTPPQ
jgi:CheY-like chemotaxis protein/class 3 adenylate cyclase